LHLVGYLFYIYKIALRVQNAEIFNLEASGTYGLTEFGSFSKVIRRTQNVVFRIIENTKGFETL
jgi:hypothetical protein